MADRTEVQYNRDGHPVVRVSDPVLARSLALDVNTWRDKVTAAESFSSSQRAQAESFSDRARKAVRELEAYKEQVREVAIRVADDQGWCRDGLNETLEELGLKKFVKKYLVTVQVKVIVEDPDVDDDYDARSEAQDFVNAQLSSNDDETYVLDGVEYSDVEELDD